MEPLLVAAVREVRPETLALQGDTRLLGPGVELVDDAVHEPRQIERLAVELHEPRAQARHLEDLVDEPEQALGALRDDVHEAFLLLRERAGDTVAEEVGGAADRRERRPELVRDGREELPLRLLHLAQLARHRVEGLRERPHLVVALDRDGLTERAGGDLGRRRRQHVEGAGDPLGDDGRAEQREADGRAQRDEHRGPGARLQARRLGLRLEDARVSRRHQLVEVRRDVLGEHPRLGVGQTQRRRARAALQERVLLGDDAAVPRERGARRAKVHRLLLAQRVLGETLEVLCDSLRPLGPRRRVTRIVQHHRAGLELHERRDRLTGGRGELERGDRVGGDLLIEEDEPPHRTKAQELDAHEHCDHECRGDEDFRSQPHATPSPVPTAAVDEPSPADRHLIIR